MVENGTRGAEIAYSWNEAVPCRADWRMWWILGQRMVERIMVYEDKFTVEFKVGEFGETYVNFTLSG